MRSDELLGTDPRAHVLVAPPGADPKEYTQERGRGRGGARGRGRRRNGRGGAAKMDVDRERDKDRTGRDDEKPKEKDGELKIRGQAEAERQKEKEEKMDVDQASRLDRGIANEETFPKDGVMSQVTHLHIPGCSLAELSGFMEGFPNVKFLDVGERDALRSYLISRLERTKRTVSSLSSLDSHRS